MLCNRNRLLASAVVSSLGAAAVLLPGAANATPHHNRGLTIATSANVITAGEGILVYGELKGANNANQPILLFHRINPTSRFTLVGTTRTNASGYYEFVRADGVVVSNRNWFVRGPAHTHSRTVHERVASVLTLSANESTVSTRQQVQFTGTVIPGHPGRTVLLQEQSALSGNGWHTIAHATTTSSSSFTIDHVFGRAGTYTLRAYLGADARNTPGQSIPLTLTVQQAQNPSFTINASASTVADGQTETISGTLYAAGSSTTPRAGVPVLLYGRTASGHSRVLAIATTDSSGAYSFTRIPVYNAVYAVRTASLPASWTADLYVGVQDTLTATASSATIAVGDAVTIAGTVAPEHDGHVVNLQREMPDGNWMDVESGRLHRGSTYSFSYPFGEPGSVNLRVEIPGGPLNVGAVSAPLSVTAVGIAPVTTLPPAS